MTKLHFNCPRCQNRLHVPITYVTKMVRCPFCSQPTRVPRAGVPNADETPVAAGLELPQRSARAPYLADLEAAAQSKRGPASRPAELIAERRFNRWLIAANVIAALAVIGVLLYLFVPWSAWVGEDPPADPPPVNPASP